MTNETPKKSVKVVEYRVGKKGYQDVATYDAVRYEGPANEYKQTVMANAYTRLIGSLEGKRVLDVGCGTGRGVASFAREAAFAAGSDASLDMLTFAARKSEGNTRCGFVNAYAQQLPFRDASFDVVTTLNFLHLFDLGTQRDMIAEMKRVVRPGGILVLEFDNALHGGIVGLYKRWFSDERGSFPHEIRRVIGDSCRVVKVYGAVFPIIWRLLFRIPGVSIPLEKIAYLPPFNRLSHRIYYKLEKLSA